MRQMTFNDILEAMDQAYDQAQRDYEQQERDAIQEEADNYSTPAATSLYDLMYRQLCKDLIEHEDFPCYEDIAALQLVYELENNGV